MNELIEIRKLSVSLESTRPKKKTYKVGMLRKQEPNERMKLSYRSL